MILCAAFDFWTVKNVTGRLLVGLKWSSKFDENGDEQWVGTFETNFDEKRNNKVDTTFFWFFQWTNTIIWGLFLFLNIIGISFIWVMDCLI